MEDFARLPFYHAAADSAQAKRLLQNRRVGAFLLRPGQSHGGLSVSLQAEHNIKNYAIRKRTNGAWQLENANPREFPSLEALLQHYKTSALSSKEATRLQHPVRHSDSGDDANADKIEYECSVPVPTMVPSARAPFLGRNRPPTPPARPSRGWAHHKESNASDSPVELALVDTPEYTQIQHGVLNKKIMDSVRRCSDLKMQQMQQRKSSTPHTTAHRLSARRHESLSESDDILG